MLWGIYGVLIFFYKKKPPVQHNQVLVDLMATHKWFEIEHYYQQNKDSFSNWATLMYTASTGYAFNRPLEAFEALEQLTDMIETGQLKVGKQVFMRIMIEPALNLCSDLREYQKGEDFCQKFLHILQNDSLLELDNSEILIRQMNRFSDEYKSEALKYPKTEIEKHKESDNQGDINLIPNTSGNSIVINAKWNGINLRTLFDTGVSDGGYIYNREIAKMLGIQLITTDTILANGNLRCLKGIVDSLEFGNFTIKNILVTVNVETLDTADSSMILCDSLYNSQLDIILGMPIIKQLGAIELDFVKKTMSFPQKTPSYPKRNLYIENSVLYMNTELCNEDFLSHFDTGSGNCLAINTDFYEKHKRHFVIDTQERQEKGHWAGCTEASTKYFINYPCPQIKMKINDQAIKFINDCSVAKDKESDHLHGVEEGGFLGNGIFKYCKKATFDFDRMVFYVTRK